MNAIKIIETFSNAPGVSGFEDEVIYAAKNYIQNSLDVVGVLSS